MSNHVAIVDSTPFLESPDASAATREPSLRSSITTMLHNPASRLPNLQAQSIPLSRTSSNRRRGASFGNYNGTRTEQGRHPDPRLPHHARLPASDESIAIGGIPDDDNPTYMSPITQHCPHCPRLPTVMQLQRMSQNTAHIVRDLFNYTQVLTRGKYYNHKY